MVINHKQEVMYGLFKESKSSMECYYVCLFISMQTRFIVKATLWYSNMMYIKGGQVAIKLIHHDYIKYWL